MKLERLTCHTPVAAARAELIRRVDRTHPPHPFDQVGKKAPVWVVDPRTTVDHIGTVPLLTGREHRNIWEPGSGETYELSITHFYPDDKAVSQ